MHPSQFEQLVQSHQAELSSIRGRRRDTRRSSGRLTHLTRKGLQKTGLGLIRLGVRLAGPGPLPHGSPSGGIGISESPS
jgi:hypothetical protein